MKRLITIFLSLLLLCGVFAGCQSGAADDGKLSVVATVFPAYDWVKNITEGAENTELVYLLSNGVDMHSYQPSAQDMIAVADCDVFVYVGGESEQWVEDALKSQSNPNRKVVNLMDCLGDKAKTEETVEGMQSGEEDEAHANDEHIWLSLRNAATCCDAVCDALCKADSADKELFETNTKAYTEKLTQLDKLCGTVFAQKQCDTLIFGDRFPFRYLTEDYGLQYYAAFPGCSAETEASFDTVLFLADKLKESNAPAVLTIDSSDQALAKTVIETSKRTDAEILTLNSMQAESGDTQNTYLGVMQQNFATLQKALRCHAAE